MRTYLTLLQISASAEVVRFVWVRAYTRHRNGKLEKVRSYYRCSISSVIYIFSLKSIKMLWFLGKCGCCPVAPKVETISSAPYVRFWGTQGAKKGVKRA